MISCVLIPEKEEPFSRIQQTPYMEKAKKAQHTSSNQ